MTITAPWRRLLAEFLGTALLVTAVVGSGVMATTLSPHDVGLQLLENSTATGLVLLVAADVVVVPHRRTPTPPSPPCTR